MVLIYFYNCYNFIKYRVNGKDLFMNIIEFKVILSFINGFDINQFISEAQKIYSKIGIKLDDFTYKKDAIDLIDKLNLSEKIKLNFENRNNFIFDEIVLKVDIFDIPEEFILSEVYSPINSLNNQFLHLHSINLFK